MVRWILDTFSLLQVIEELCPVLVLVNAPSVRRSGTGVCRKIRDAFSSVDMRLVVLGPEIPEEALVAWLDCGADDYINDAVGAVEFLSRVRAILRSLEPQSAWDSPVISSLAVKIGDIELDASGMRLVIQGRDVPITNLEFRLLQFLIKQGARVFARDELLDIVWREEGSRTLRRVDACIRRLREKIEAAGGQSIRLTTIRGVGYRLDRAAFTTSIEEGSREGRSILGVRDRPA
jgi:two-component system phosphate regulon response regulator PhoB